MKKIIYRPIGIIHSPFREPSGTPIQAAGAKGIDGRIEIFPEYVEGLKDLEGFSHIFLIYHFHLCHKPSLTVRPFLDKSPHGVFSTRAPARPNPIGLSVVRLIRVDGNMLFIQDLDIIDGTFLLDIKPYVPEFDERKRERIGWLEENIHRLNGMQDDGRFKR
ncbi:MAG: tRNA (N6-threonylcarbamoyladenosine(37)-N6)-methyltransferase TrmO [bacterium]